MYRVAERYGPFAAYCFDNAVTTFGRTLEAELDGVKGKSEKQTATKRQRLLDKWLDRPLKYRSVSMQDVGPTSDGKGDVESSFTMAGGI